MNKMNLKYILIILFILILIQPVHGLFGRSETYYKIPDYGLACWPLVFSKTITAGSSATQTIDVWEINSTQDWNYSVNFSKSSGNPGNWISFSEEKVWITTPLLTNQSIATISVPSGQTAGTYLGNIFVVNSSYPFSRGNCTINATITVEAAVTPPVIPPPVGPGGGGAIGAVRVLDTKITIEPGSEIVTPGSRIYATINIIKVGGPSGLFDIDLRYKILDPSGKKILESTETVAIGDDPRGYDFLRYVDIPVDAPEGLWKFEVSGTYDVSTDTSSATFEVTSALPGLSIVEYPKNIITRQDEIEYISIRVENIGTKLLRNVRVVVQGVPSYWYSVEPETVDLSPDIGQTFVIKFEIPEEASIRDFPIILKAFSGPVIDEKSSTLTIKEKTYKLIKIENIKISKFVVNRRGNIDIVLRNRGTIPLEVTVTLDFPEGFYTDKKTITEDMLPEEKMTFKFLAVSEKIGTFAIPMLIEYPEDSIRKDIIVNVYPFEINWWLILLILIIIIAAVILLRRRKKIKRPWKISEIKISIRR